MWLDHIDWWEGRSFLVNLASGFTSLCFGVPTALLVLTPVSNALADARLANRADNHARSEVEELQRGFMSIFNAADLQELETKIAQALRALHPLNTRRDPEGSYTAAFFDIFNDILRLGRGPTRNYRAPANFESLARDHWQWRRVEAWHVRLGGQWRVINEEVRPRLIECGVAWYGPDHQAQLAMKRLLDEADTRSPWRLPEGATRQDAIKAMNHFLIDVRALCSAAARLSREYPPPGAQRWVRVP
ncbi:hypothetical protein [Streptomyces sp. UH6]|uniref:hypothetical protein n=1 Tax=Streptomyces sp. UH6 TaxID=2748379 RepID=UPI0015D4D801|nr:hypothetical protein [Streptomyces sp. UH6]NYV73380.1 hypothetical protein [Streptomyces sp. UH6]